MPLYKRHTPPRRTRVCVCSLSLALARGSLFGATCLSRSLSRAPQRARLSLSLSASLASLSCLGLSRLSLTSPRASPSTLASQLFEPTRRLGSTSSYRLGSRLTVALVSASRASRLLAPPQPSSTPAPLPPSRVAAPLRLLPYDHLGRVYDFRVVLVVSTSVDS